MVFFSLSLGFVVCVGHNILSISLGWNKLIKQNREYVGKILRSMKAPHNFSYLWNPHPSITQSGFWFATYISCFKSKLIQVDVGFSEKERLTFWQQTNYFAKEKKNNNKKICLQGENVPVIKKQNKKNIESVRLEKRICTADFRSLWSFSFPTYWLKQIRKKAQLVLFHQKKLLLGLLLIY